MIGRNSSPHSIMADDDSTVKTDTPRAQMSATTGEGFYFLITRPVAGSNPAAQEYRYLRFFVVPKNCRFGRTP